MSNLKTVWVILFPGSNSNPSTQYRVAAANDVTAFLNGGKLSYAYTQFKTYEEALGAQEVLNKEA